MSEVKGVLTDNALKVLEGRGVHVGKMGVAKAGGCTSLPPIARKRLVLFAQKHPILFVQVDPQLESALVLLAVRLVQLVSS